MIAVKLSDDELDLAILALDYFRREHLADYDEEDRAQIAKELAALTRKLRDA